MSDSTKRKISTKDETKDVEHIDQVLDRKNKKDKGSRKYVEEQK